MMSIFLSWTDIFSDCLEFGERGGWGEDQLDHIREFHHLYFWKVISDADVWQMRPDIRSRLFSSQDGEDSKKGRCHCDTARWIWMKPSSLQDERTESTAEVNLINRVSCCSQCIHILGDLIFFPRFLTLQGHRSSPQQQHDYSLHCCCVSALLKPLIIIFSFLYNDRWQDFAQRII